MSRKQVYSRFPGSKTKEPACTVDGNSFHQRHPAWRFSRSKKYNSSEFGWTSLENHLFDVVAKLHDLEVQKWSDIFRDRKKHHFINIENITPEAQQLLAKNHEDIPQVFSLRLSGKTRIWGIIESGTGILDVIWWDPEHKICPSQMKHT